MTTTLLPQNATEQEQALDQLAATKLAIDLAPIDTNARTCDAKLLPWLALAWRLNITGLSVNEQRQLIANAAESHKYKGTVHAAQQALNAVFSDAHIQQFQDPAKPYEFSAQVKITADTTRVYDTTKFDTARRLVNEAKNVGTRLVSFDIAMPDGQLLIAMHSAATMTPTLATHVNLTATTNIQVTGAAQWML